MTTLYENIKESFGSKSRHHAQNTCIFYIKFFTSDAPNEFL